MYDLDAPEDQSSRPTPFMSWTLWLAGLYNLVWGAVVILAPQLAFDLFGMEQPRYPQIWQCVGMIVGVYGVGYFIASADAYRHWPIVLVGLLGKVFGPIGFLVAALQGTLPWSWGTIILCNDLIWWVPFGYILYESLRNNTDSSIGNAHDLDEATIIFPSNLGCTLTELSNEQPVMVVFLRHFGCTFCREALQDLSKNREAIERQGVAMALVHMGSPSSAAAITEEYGLDDIDQFSDSSCEIYRAFGIKRGSFSQLFGLKVIWRGIYATLNGNLIGALAGDGFRMPGVFFLHRGEIHGAFRHKSAADRPNYAELAKQFRTSLENDADQLSA